MPPLETMDLRQRAVVWDVVGADQYGEPTVSDDPREIPVWWTWTRKEITDANGNTVTIDAQVVTAEEIGVDSLLWLGKLCDLPTGSSFSAEDEELMVVVSFRKAGDVLQRHTRRELSVQRFRDTLPTQETPPDDEDA